MKFLSITKEDVLTLSADDGVHCIEWSVDSAFAVHPDMKSHIGGTMMFKGGKGAIIGTSAKQKMNTDSSTTAELAGVSQVLPLILWSKLFIEAQGYKMKDNVLFQENKSTILLANNGKASSGKRTRALNIRYFYITNKVKQGNIIIQYCSTDKMTSDFMSKSLQGTKFDEFQKTIMGLDN